MHRFSVSFCRRPWLPFIWENQHSWDSKELFPLRRNKGGASEDFYKITFPDDANDEVEWGSVVEDAYYEDSTNNKFKMTEQDDSSNKSDSDQDYDDEEPIDLLADGYDSDDSQASYNKDQKQDSMKVEDTSNSSSSSSVDVEKLAREGRSGASDGVCSLQLWLLQQIGKNTLSSP